MRKAFIGYMLATTFTVAIGSQNGRAEDNYYLQERPFLATADADPSSTSTPKPEVDDAARVDNRSAYEERMTYARRLIHERAKRQADARNARIETRRWANQFVTHPTYTLPGFYPVYYYGYTPSPARVYSPVPRRYYRLPLGQRNVRR